MLSNLTKKIFGSRNDRLLKQYRKTVSKINALEESMQALSDEALKAKTAEFKERLSKGETLDDILPEAFAVCREASRRVLGMRHFDVQLIGGMVLHDGKIAEMRTGEGKTLVATLPVYLNALSGKGVHVVTVNDYLAERDAGIMEPLYGFLGLSVGVILSNQEPFYRQTAYNADITYGTNNEFGFDYLRDNMVTDQYDKVQRELNFAVVDEVDSILIDEARTPLIISGQADDNVQLYQVMNQVPPLLSRQEKEDSDGDFWVDEKAHQVILSEAGHEHAEDILIRMGLLKEGDSLYSTANIMLMHHLMAALRAHNLFHLDQHYVVKDGEIVIVDEHTGRLMDGRRWSDGLHQAVEAKEGVEIKRENQTLASITFQNYFRLYAKLSGMTGTADTEAYEFQNIYNLETVIIPTNRPIKRKDYNDQIFRTAEEKYEAVIKDIQACHEKGQPVLVGTTTIENSELVSRLLDKAGLPHNVLNAKEHQREALIVAQAGKPGMITVATNMAGRGTDIVLGGNVQHQSDAIRNDENLSDDEKEAQIRALENGWEEDNRRVLEAGGLHIIGTERHESRRIDNQLRGRSGRQGDPGSSRFYVALDDNLVRIFAGERMASMMQRLGMSEDEAIESRMVSKQIEGAQRKVEAHNFDARKNLLEYDNVANEQRKVIYTQRANIMDADNIAELVAGMRVNVIDTLASRYIDDDQVRQNWDIPGLEAALRNEFGLAVDIQNHWLQANPNMSAKQIKEGLVELLEHIQQEKENQVGGDIMRRVEKYIALQTIDTQWKQHLATMDMLRQAIWLRSRAQKDPKREYQRESFELFKDLLDHIQFEIVRVLAHIQFQAQSAADEAEAMQQQAQRQHDAELARAQYHGSSDSSEALREPTPEEIARTGRNDPCPCGSGKRLKDCHGKLA